MRCRSRPGTYYLLTNISRQAVPTGLSNTAHMRLCSHRGDAPIIVPFVLLIECMEDDSENAPCRISWLRLKP